MATAVACGGSDDSADGGRNSTTTESTAAESTTTDVAQELCATLRSEPYEVRKSAFEAASSEEATAARQTCEGHVDSLAAAQAIEESAAGLTDHELPSDFTCNSDPMGPSVIVTVAITNDTDLDVGVYGRMVRKPSEDKSDWYSEPFVAWRLAPGETFEHSAHLPRGATGGQCSLGFDAFVNDPSPADASIPDDVASHNESDADPAESMLAAWDLLDEGALAGEPHTVALFEDVRSADYVNMLDQLAAPDPSYGAPLDDFEFCRTIATDEADHFLVEYFRSWSDFDYTDADGKSATSDADASTAIAAFRRGSDGRWRWLGGIFEMHGRRCGDAGF